MCRIKLKFHSSNYVLPEINFHKYFTLKYIINAAKNTPTLCTKSPSTWMNAARTFKSFRIFDLDFKRLSYSTFACNWELELLSSLPPGDLFPEPWEWPWPPPNPWECPCPDPWSAIPSLKIKQIVLPKFVICQVMIGITPISFHLFWLFMVLWRHLRTRNFLWVFREFLTRVTDIRCRGVLWKLPNT